MLAATADAADPQVSSLVQVIYASAASHEFSSQELAELLGKARQNNAKRQVTGILFYKDQSFLQVLEGPEHEVNKVYQRISQDSRHNRVTLLLKRNLERRNFGEWRMGFVKNRAENDNLAGFVDYFGRQSFVRLVGDYQRVEELMQGFRDGLWRQHVSD
jgi:hypothetical protein